MNTMDRIIREQARLILLKALAEQVDERLNSDLLRETLELFGISKPREWVHQQLDYLAELSAVSIISAGTIKVATLTELGSRHLARTAVIEGVKRPSRQEA